jgi:uncharacterized repeat protein (TIGR03803 family)
MRCKQISLSVTIAAMLATTLLMAGKCAASAEKVLYNFSNSAGYQPKGGLVADAGGNLYGTTFSGGTGTCMFGSPSCGTVFELSPLAGGGWRYKTIHNFGNSKDGEYPEAGLITDGAGNLYGTTSSGGTHGYGTVFELSPATGGSWSEKLLHSFNVGGTDGFTPAASLVMDGSGNIYGTTQLGGTGTCTNGSVSGCGVVFELSAGTGGGWTETILHNFQNDGIDGTGPVGALLFDGSGNIYGATGGGGPYDVPPSYEGGVAFELTPAGGGVWTETILHSFGNGSDGADPLAGLIFDTHGNLYGTSWAGGTRNLGTVFELSPAGGGTWTETLLASFGGDDNVGGASPEAGLIFDTAGDLFGTTTGGGVSTDRSGTAFELKPGGGGSWTRAVLHSFGVGTDGADPSSGLISLSGKLYGMTALGGTNGLGTVFALEP